MKTIIWVLLVLSYLATSVAKGSDLLSSSEPRDWTTNLGSVHKLTLIVQDQNGNRIPEAIAQASHEGHAHVHKSNNGVITFDLSSDSVRLVVQAIGYNSYRGSILLRRDTTINLTLSPASADKAEIEILTLYQRTQTQSISRLGKEDLNKAKGQMLGEVLGGLSGVSMFKTGASIVKPVIHGQSGQRIIIMNAGAKQEGQQWGDEHAPEIDPSVADSLVVVKGAAGVRYGPDAIGGVIVVEPTKPKANAGTVGEATFAASSNNRMGFGNLRLETYQRIGALKSGVYARIQTSGKYAGDGQTPTYNLVNTGYRERNLSLLTGIEGYYGHLEAFYSLFQTELGIFAGSHIGNLSDLQRAIAGNEPSIQGPFSYEINRPRQAISHELLRVKYEHLVCNKIKVGIIGSRQYNTRQEYDILRTAADNASDRAQLNFRLTTFQGEFFGTNAKISKWQHRVGITALRQSNTWDGRYLIPSFVATGVGGYSTQSYKSNIGIFEAGLRYDLRQMSAYFNNGLTINEVPRQWQGLAANFGYVTDLGHHLSWTTNLGYAWRPPSVNELYSDGLHHGAAAIERGDANLTAERSVKLTTTLEANLPTAMLVATAYVQHFENYIYMVPRLPAEQTIRGAFPVFQFTQVPALFYGLDLDATVPITNRLSAKGMATLVFGTQTTSGQGILFVPPPRLRVNFNYQLLSTDRYQLYAGIGGLTVAQQTNAPADLDYAPTPAGYTVWTSEAGLRFRTQGQWATLHLQIDNLLNSQYRDYLNRFRYYADELGRNVSIRLTVPFGFQKS